MSSHHKIAINSLLVAATLSLSACNNSTDKLSTEQVSESVWASHVLTGTSLNEANSHFFIIDTVIAALQKKVEDPDLTSINCWPGDKSTDNPSMQLSLTNDIFSVSFNGCLFHTNRDFLFSVTGDVSLKLDKISSNGFLLDFTGQLNANNLGFSYSSRKLINNHTSYSAEISQYSSNEYNSTTDITFTSPLVLNTESSELPDTVTFDELSIQRQLDYRIGQYTASYNGQLTTADYKGINHVTISTVTPITRIRNRVIAGEYELTDNLDSVINMQLEETTDYAVENYQPSYTISADVENYGPYVREASVIYPVFPENHDRKLSFTAQNRDLSKFEAEYYSGYFTSAVGLDSPFCIQSLSKPLIISDPEQVAKIAVMPLLTDVQQINVYVTDSDDLPLSPSLYRVSLEGLWLRISFQEGVLTKPFYRATITDTFGHELCNGWPLADAQSSY
ncbi:hypothetical protein ACVFI8_18230 [Agarivorans sp. MS3-6]